MQQIPFQRGLQIPKRPRFQSPVLSPPPLSSPPRKPFQWTTRHTFCGTGLQETSPFRVGDRWRLVWSRDPATVERPGYVVVITMNGSDGSSGDSGIKTVCEQKSISSVDEIRGGGQICLRIICGGEWTVQVQERKQIRHSDD